MFDKIQTHIKTIWNYFCKKIWVQILMRHFEMPQTICLLKHFITFFGDCYKSKELKLHFFLGAKDKW